MPVLDIARPILLVLDTCLKVALADGISSFITAWARCEQTWIEERPMDPSQEWSSLSQCFIPDFRAYFVYNLTHGAALLQFAALYTALRVHVEPVRDMNWKVYIHLLLCGVWVFATSLGEPCTPPLSDINVTHGMDSTTVAGHHRSLPELFRETYTYRFFTRYVELPSLFFAFAAFQRATAPTTTGVYGHLLYWSLPPLGEAAGRLLGLPMLHLMSFRTDMDQFLTPLISKGAVIVASHITAVFLDVLHGVVALGICLLEIVMCLGSFPPLSIDVRRFFVVCGCPH